MALLASNSDIDIDLSKLSEAERQAILEVVRRDRELRQHELDYIEKLESEIVQLRQADYAEEPNKCARCGVELWWLFRRGEFCSECRDKICEKCRRPVTKSNTPSQNVVVISGNGIRNWICVLCSKERELRALTGAWFYQSLKFRRSRRSRRSKKKLNDGSDQKDNAEPGEFYFLYDGGSGVNHGMGDENVIDVDEVDSMYRKNKQSEHRHRRTTFEFDDDDNLSAISEMSEAESLSSLLLVNGALDRTGRATGGVERINDADPHLSSIAEHNRQLLARSVAKRIVDDIVGMKKDYVEIQLASSGISPDKLRSPPSRPTPAVDDVTEFNYDDALSYLTFLSTDPFLGVGANSKLESSQDDVIKPTQNSVTLTEPNASPAVVSPSGAKGNKTNSNSKPNGTITVHNEVTSSPRSVSFSETNSSPRALTATAVLGSSTHVNGSSESGQISQHQRQQQQLKNGGLSNGVPGEQLKINGTSSTVDDMNTPPSDESGDKSSNEMTPKKIGETEVQMQLNENCLEASQTTTEHGQQLISDTSSDAVNHVPEADHSSISTTMNHQDGRNDVDGDAFDSAPRSAEDKRSMSRSQLSSVTSGSQESIPSTYSGISQSTSKSATITGEICVQLNYNGRFGVLEVQVKECRDLIPVSKKGCNSYVKVHLLPDTSKTNVMKTKVVKRSVDPSFEETMSFDVTQNEVANRTVWLCVWHKDRFGRNVSLGDVLIPLENQKFGYDDVKPVWYHLQPNRRQQWKSKSFSTSSAEQRAFIELSLKCADSDTSKQSRKSKTPKGELHVVIKRAGDLLPVKTTGQINPFCKIRLLPDKNSQKSAVVKKDCNPTWNQTFIFSDVNIDDLSSNRRLELTVWDYERLSSGSFLGGISLGSGVVGGSGDSQNAEVNLWQRMLLKPNEWVDGILQLRLDVKPA